MASSLVVLNNAIVNQSTQSQSNNSNDLNTNGVNGVNNNEASLINIVGSRVSSAASSSSMAASSNTKNSIVSITNSDRTSLPPLNISSPVKNLQNLNEDVAQIMSPKVYVSTHHLKMSNNVGKENNNYHHHHNSLASFETSNLTSFDKNKVTIVNNTRENNNSAKIKIKYNYNNFSGAPLPSPTNGAPSQFFGPLDSPNSLSNKKLSNEMETRSSPSSSSPSSPSSLISNHSEASNSSPLPNVSTAVESLNSPSKHDVHDDNERPQVYLKDEQHTITDVNLVMESNKLHLAIVKPNVLRRSSSFIVDEINENTGFVVDNRISKMSESPNGKENQDNGETEANENSSSSNDSNDSHDKYLMSDFRMSKSPTPNPRDNKSCPSSAKPTKAKKRVSFNDSLVQVHLIPNVSNILNIEKYKCYVRNSALTATMITSLPCTDGDSDAYYQVNYQSVDSKFVPHESTTNIVDERAVNSEAINSDLSVIEQNTNENDARQNINNQSNNSNQENLPNLNEPLTGKGILTSSKSHKNPNPSILKRIDSPIQASDLKKNASRNNHIHFTNHSTANRMAAYPVNIGVNSEFAVITNQIQNKNPNDTNALLTVIGNSSNGFPPRSPHHKRETTNISAAKSNGHSHANQRSYSSLSNNTTSISPQFIINVNPYHHHQQQQQQAQQQYHHQIQQQQQFLQMQLEQEQAAATQVSNHSMPYNLNDASKLNEQTSANFLHPKPPKYLSSNLRIMSASSNNSNGSLKSNEQQKYLKIANNRAHIRLDPNNDLNSNPSPPQLNVTNTTSEISPQSKYFANLKKLRPSINSSLSHSVPDELFEINGNFENSENINILNTTPVVIKSVPSPKIINPTKYIFLKSEEKPPQHTNENLVLNRSNTMNNLRFENFNSNSFTSDMSKNTTGSDFKNSIISGDYITSLSSYGSVNNNNNSNNNNNNSNNKNIAMSTVNQLVALKDVNYYLANSSKQAKKAQSYSQTGNYVNGKPQISINPNMNNQVTEIKLRTNPNNNNPNQMSESDFRRTHSALPLLRNSVKLQNNNFPNGNNIMNTNNNVNINTIGNTGTDLKNGIKGINTTISYKLVNSPMINSLTRAKSFLYNQNTTTHGIDRRLRGGSIEKTSL